MRISMLPPAGSRQELDLVRLQGLHRRGLLADGCDSDAAEAPGEV